MDCWRLCGHCANLRSLGWLCSQLAFVVFWQVSFSTLYISDWCPAFTLTLLVLLWGNIAVTFWALSWLILVWGAAPTFPAAQWGMDPWTGAETCEALHHCTWLFWFLCINVQGAVQPKEKVKDYAGEAVLEGVAEANPGSHLCPVQPEIPAWHPLQGLGSHFKCAQLNKDGLNSASFSEASAALAWLAKMPGNLASNCVNWLVCWVFIWMSSWIN